MSPLRILHLSDTHFGTELSPVADALLRLSEAQAPQMAILSGDITQRAHRAEFAAAASFLECLEIPVLALPGNHDIPLFNLASRILSPYGNYRHALRAPLMPRFENEQLLALGVNTTRWYRHTDGEVSPGQIERIGARLGSAKPGQLRIVVTHQPVHVIEQRDLPNLLRGHQAAIRAWSAAGADLILGGHIHLPYARNLREHYPDLARPTWCVQAGTAISRRVRFEAPNSVNIIDYDSAARACLLQRWDFDRSEGEFRLQGQTPMALD
ncbi:MAG: 3,5-cyclic phosphodiesterase CpdA [Hydrocarboniphaga sp.]|uniref:metallophosphoesterase family protein n=1 Tax=Hydrocarboniphaga sp. TaxID=2033016 RepID=UPI0026146DC3|nr:metallophosphoesterase [Hydrocarboniphaga sp.]MDB5968543.1 3,5-cyclic phosphodiesterase CpdA [Hydrocarboniphaga sp.]